MECYVDALKLNPFMWDAFLGLCETGKPFDPACGFFFLFFFFTRWLTSIKV